MSTFSRVAADLDEPEAGPPPFGDVARLDRTARRVAAALLGMIVVVIAVIVFMPGPPDATGQAELQQFLAKGHRHGLPLWIDFDLVQNLSNVVMFLPIGLLGALALYRRNYLIVLYAGLASGLIELVQLVLLPDRVASWQDLRANSIGAFLGLLCAAPALRRRRKRRRRYLQGRRSARDSTPRTARGDRL